MTGTPEGSGMEICERTAMIAVHIPIMISVETDFKLSKFMVFSFMLEILFSFVNMYLLM